ncbi:MAG: DUF3794 domain-containing protein [Defluviitaleaceae bacterium]|nr:DUF3794 domain-containing protein [Defluviitaleaceae bacterium]
MELVRENILLNKIVGEGRSQILLEGDIIVPDVRPDIDSVLRATARVAVSKANASMGRVSFAGKMNVDVLYLAKGNDETTVHNISAVAHIDDFLNIDGIQADNWVNLVGELANIDYRVVNDRKLNYRAVVDIKAMAFENGEVTAIQSVEGLSVAQQKSAFFSVNNVIAKQMDSFTIRDEIALPSNKPAVSELLQANVSIANKQVTIASGRVDVSGDLLVAPLYKGNDETSVVEFEEFVLPFNGSLDIAQADERAFVDASLMVADSLVEVSPNETGEMRIFALEAIIAADVKISENRDIEILEDAYCIEQNMDLQLQSLDYKRLVCRNQNQFQVKEVVAMDAPEALQVLQVNGTARIEDVKVVEDKVVVEGLLEADVLYIAQSDTDPLYNYTAHIPIRQVIEAKGAKMGMEAEISCNIDNISFNMVSGREVDLRITLGLDVAVQESATKDFVHDIEFSPFDLEALDSLPSMTILVAEKGDSLWSVAKKYNADLEELASINDIQTTDDLVIGQKLLVVKKVAQE